MNGISVPIKETLKKSLTPSQGHKDTGKKMAIYEPENELVS